MINLTIKPEVQAAADGLNAMGVEIPNVKRRLLGAVGRAGRDRVRSRMGSYLQLDHLAATSGGQILTGRKGKKFLGTFKQRVYGYSRSESHWVVAAPRYIAEPLEKGATITPKNGKFLSFQGSDGSFHRMTSVTIPALHWFTQSIEGFDKSGEVDFALSEAEERLIKKFQDARPML